MNRISAVILLSMLGLWSCQPKQQPPPGPVPVNIITAKAIPVTYYDKYPGTTTALFQVNLYPELQGAITDIFVKDGAHVKKGEKLYEIDRRLYQSAYDQAQANLKAAQNNEIQAQQDADRYTYLNSQDAVAKQLYDHAIITLQVNKNQVEAAEQSVKSAATNLNYSIITAPFDGTVGFSQVRIGNMVTVGQTVLNTISTDDPMGVDFLVNEKQLSDYEKLEKSKPDAHDSLFTILMPDNSLYPNTGKISVIDRAVDPQTGSIRVRLVFPNQQNTLSAGMSCIVRVRNQDAAPQIVIPGKAVTEQMGEYFVFVIKDTVIARPDSAKAKEPDTARGPRPRAFQRKVQLGQTLGPNVIIKGGISEGERIVIDGVQLIHDGSVVNTATKPSSPGGGKDKQRENGTVDSTKKN